MLAEIIAVGSEMLTPHRQDTNSLYLTSGLNDLGIEVAFKTIVGDNIDHLAGAIRTGLARADVILISGGLGPTEDDLTREAVAATLNIGLRRDPDLIAALHRRFADRGIQITANNEKQADVLDGAEILENRSGSAAGQYLQAKFEGQPRIVILLPGPPKELIAMFDEQCKSRLAASVPARHLARRLIRICLTPESQVDARTAPIYKQFGDVETTILAHSGEIQLHFLCAKADPEQARARVDELVERIERELQDLVFSSHGESLEEVVLLMLGVRHLTLAAAESCTGGLLSQRLTAVPNSSRSFLGGAIVYTASLKTIFADVPKDLIDVSGPVSPEVARALAEGMRARTGASLCISITGLAGPGGAPPGPDERKPIGLVYIALADGQSTEVKELHLPGDRDRVRWWSSQHALELIRRKLL